MTHEKYIQKWRKEKSTQSIDTHEKWLEKERNIMLLYEEKEQRKKQKLHNLVL